MLPATDLEIHRLASRIMAWESSQTMSPLLPHHCKPFTVSDPIDEAQGGVKARRHGRTRDLQKPGAHCAKSTRAASRGSLHLSLAEMRHQSSEVLVCCPSSATELADPRPLLDVQSPPTRAKVAPSAPSSIISARPRGSFPDACPLPALCLPSVPSALRL